MRIELFFVLKTSIIGHWRSAEAKFECKTMICSPITSESVTPNPKKIETPQVSRDGIVRHCICLDSSNEGREVREGEVFYRHFEGTFFSLDPQGILKPGFIGPEWRTLPEPVSRPRGPIYSPLGHGCSVISLWHLWANCGVDNDRETCIFFVF